MNIIFDLYRSKMILDIWKVTVTSGPPPKPGLSYSLCLLNGIQAFWNKRVWLIRSLCQRSCDSSQLVTVAAIIHHEAFSDLKPRKKKKKLLFDALCLWIHLPPCALKWAYVSACVSALACAWTICIRSWAEVEGPGEQRASHWELSTILHPSQSPPAVSQRTSEQEKHCLFWQAVKSISSICHTPGGSIWTRFPLQFSACRIHWARSPACGQRGAERCTRDRNGQSSRPRLGLTERKKKCLTHCEEGSAGCVGGYYPSLFTLLLFKHELAAILRDEAINEVC